MSLSKLENRPQLRHLQSTKIWIVVLVLILSVLVRGDVVRIIAGGLYLASIRSEQAGELQSADRWLSLAYRLAPSPSEARNRSGFLAFHRQDVLQAQEAFTLALAADEENDAALNNLAIIKYRQGELERADILFKQALTINPNNAVAAYNRGVLLLENHNPTEAIRAFKESTRIEPEWLTPRLRLSYTLLQLGHYADAEVAARTAIELDDQQALTHLSLAIALHHQEMYEEALIVTDRALAIRPDFAEAGMYKALALRGLGRLDHAYSTLSTLEIPYQDGVMLGRAAAESAAILDAIAQRRKIVPAEEVQMIKIE